MGFEKTVFVFTYIYIYLHFNTVLEDKSYTLFIKFYEYSLYKLKMFYFCLVNLHQYVLGVLSYCSLAEKTVYL